MVFKLVETYSEGDYNEFEVWKCTECGRTYTHPSGADCPACCPCEFEGGE